MLKQTQVWYRKSIGIGRYPKSGIGIGSEVKKCGSVHPYPKHRKRLEDKSISIKQFNPICLKRQI